MADMARPIQATGWTLAADSGKGWSSPTAIRRVRALRRRPSHHKENISREMIVSPNRCFYTSR